MSGTPYVQVRNNPEPPPPAWTKHSAPYPKDPSRTVTYYHHTATGQSTYDQPPEYAAWEKAYDAWLQAVMGGQAK